MKNGTYPCTLRALGTKYVLKITNGRMSLYDPNRDSFIRTVNKIYVDEFLDVEAEALPAENKSYDIEWSIDGVIKERMIMIAKYSVCVARVNALKSTTHKSGKLAIVPHVSKL